MTIKADWQTYLHDLRRREAEIIFRRLAGTKFNRALELGAGDGFLSRILARYSHDLLCTEINQERLKPVDLPNVRYQVLDAEGVGDTFEAKTFDFIFSSNLLEHLPDADRAIRGMAKVLTDEGIAVHVLPNRTWKITTILCYLPNKMIVTLDKLVSGRLFKRRQGHKFGHSYKQRYGGNNQNIGPKRQSRLTKLFLPPVHGVSGNTAAELSAFGEEHWIKKFEAAGFEVQAILKMPFSSGYGFGFARVSGLMERLGLSSATAFVLRKKR